MSNGHIANGERAMVVYADQCNPDIDPDWYGYKVHHFGGDDDVVFLAADEILILAGKRPDATHLRIDLSASSVFIALVVKP